MEHVVDMNPSLQRDSSDPMQNNNGDSTTPASTGEGAPEKKLMLFAIIVALMEMVASGLGVVLFWGVTVVLLGGLVITLNMMDIGLVGLTLGIEFIRIIHRKINLNLRHMHNIQQQMMWIIRFISWPSRLSYWLQIIFALIISVLSAIWLKLQDFGKTEEEKDNTIRNITLNIFYAVVLTKATLLFAEKAIWKWTVSCYSLFEKVNAECGFGPSGMVFIERFFYEAYSKCVTGSIFDVLTMDLVNSAEGLLVSSSSGEQLMGADILVALSYNVLLSDATLGKILTSMDSKVIGRLIQMLICRNSFEEKIRYSAALIVSKLAEKEPNVLLSVAGMKEAMESANKLLGHK